MMALSFFFFFEVRQRGPQGRGTTDGHLKKGRRHSINITLLGGMYIISQSVRSVCSFLAFRAVKIG